MYRRGRIWWISYPLPGGGHRYESSQSTNKPFAQKLEAIRRAEVAEGRLRLPRSNPPSLEAWSSQFLDTVPNSVTRTRYATSVRTLLAFFRTARLAQITADRIEEFKQARLKSRVGPGTVNRDLAVLHRMLKLAARQRLIAHSPFDEVEFLEERSQRRQPHILTFEEQGRLLAVAPPVIKMLVVLITETGLRIGKEAFPLKWEDVDLLNDVIHVRQSETPAGKRSIPLSGYCKAELLRWRDLAGPMFSQYVFPNFSIPSSHILRVKRSWATTLRNAGLEYFPIYSLRATFASRLSAAGAPDLFVAQMMGHSTPSILQTYAKVIDEYRRDAISKLEAFRQSHSRSATALDAGPEQAKMSTGAPQAPPPERFN